MTYYQDSLDTEAMLVCLKYFAMNETSQLAASVNPNSDPETHDELAKYSLEDLETGTTDQEYSDSWFQICRTPEYLVCSPDVQKRRGKEESEAVVQRSRSPASIAEAREQNKWIIIDCREGKVNNFTSRLDLICRIQLSNMICRECNAIDV